MAKERGQSRSRYREKVEMAARSADVYVSDEARKEIAVCTGCKALYKNKRWFPKEDESAKISRDMVKYEVICPACQRIEDDNPAGIVTFSGNYLVEHELEILNIIKNEAEKTSIKNPLARIMEIRQEGNVMTIRTTDDKLAQKLGTNIYKAHSGNLEYQWSKDYNFVRVNWSR